MSLAANIDTRDYYVESTTDDRAVVCDSNSEIYVVDEIPHRDQCLRAVNTLRDHIRAEMREVAAAAGFSLAEETMFVR